MNETCPTCGQRVRVHSSGEGTNSYVGVDAAQLRDVTAERDTYRTALARIITVAAWDASVTGHAVVIRDLLAIAEVALSREGDEEKRWVADAEAYLRERVEGRAAPQGGREDG
jgi:hypothetical protein